MVSLVCVSCNAMYLSSHTTALGHKIKAILNDVVELKVTYDGINPEDQYSNCPIGESYNKGTECLISFNVTKDMKPPIFIHYEITNFHQNHRGYYRSRDPYQLRGLEPSSTAKSTCSPLYKLGDTFIHPCGATANTMFNDVITLESGKDTSGNDLTMIEEGIAWASDLKFYFKQIKGFRMELCNPNGTCSADCCSDSSWSCKEPAVNKNDGLCYRYSYPNDDTTQYLYETYPDVINPLEGVENEHFVVWMRIAAHGDFRKLYAWIDQPIPAGQTLTFRIKNNYVVTRFRGSKSLIVSTTSIFGGRNAYFPAMFLGVGYFSLLAGFLFALKHKLRPRRLADESYLHYKED